MLNPTLLLILPKLKLQHIVFRIPDKLCVTWADILAHLMTVNKS